MAPRTKKRHEIVNNTEGWIGVMVIDRKGEEKSVNIEPFGRRFMTDDEIEITKEAQARKENDPFAERRLVHRNIATGDVIWSGDLPMLSIDPQGDPPYKEAHDQHRRKQIEAAEEAARLAGADEELGVPTR